MKVVQEAKAETSKWLKRQLSAGRDFAWQAGYGAFSVRAYPDSCLACKSICERRLVRWWRQSAQHPSDGGNADHCFT
jgi:hypothetical protein